MSAIKVISLDKEGNPVKEENVSINGETVLDCLRNASIPFIAPCGGNRRCHNCLVEIEIGGIRKKALACSSEPKDNMKVYVPCLDVKEEGLSFDDEDNIVCLDLGTTSLVYYLVNKQGQILKTITALNPQGAFGADVISRIQYANEHGLEPLYKAINKISEESIKAFGKVKTLYVAGNTTMLHIFANTPIKSLGVYPYTPIFLSRKEIKGKELGLSVENVVLLPSFSSFVGADLAAGYLQTDLGNGNNMLIDLGTNGEMLLTYEGNLYATSTAAGPAFEGAGIECGCGALPGAISKISKLNGKLEIETIDGARPVGLTGSSLVEAIAIMKKDGVIDSSGAFLNDEKCFFINDWIYIKQKDIRNFQLAKSSIYSGIECLLEFAKADVNKIDNVFIAGGFGHYLDIDAAIDIRLLPSNLKGKYRDAGNTSGLGCIKYGQDNKSLKILENACDKVITVDLNSMDSFLDEFVSNTAL